MTWTIAKERAGYVVWEAKDIELSPFDVLVFSDIDIPSDMGALREQLPGTKGYFQIEGQFPTNLANVIEEGHDLMLRFGSHAAKLEIVIDVQGQVKTVVPLGKKDTETSQQYDFAVKSQVYVTEDS